MLSFFFNSVKRLRSSSKSSAVILANRTPSMTFSANSSFVTEASSLDGSAALANALFCVAFDFFAIYAASTPNTHGDREFGDLPELQKRGKQSRQTPRHQARRDIPQESHESSN